MATTHAAPGELIDLHPSAQAPGSRTLVRAEHVEVFQLALAAGKGLPEHKVASVVTIQCLEGEIEVVAHGRSQAMGAGTMMYLSGGEPHAVRALHDSSILVTLLLHRA